MNITYRYLKSGVKYYNIIPGKAITGVEFNTKRKKGRGSLDNVHQEGVRTAKTQQRIEARKSAIKRNVL